MTGYSIEISDAMPHERREMMAETTVINLPTEWCIEVSALDVLTYLRITDMARSDKQYIGIFMPKDKAIALAHALLAAAGESQYPGATSAITPNRAVTRPHMFEIGDAVETSDGIQGHIEDFIDAWALIRTDHDLLLKRHITDIEYVGDHDTAAEAK